MKLFLTTATLLFVLGVLLTCGCVQQPTPQVTPTPTPMVTQPPVETQAMKNIVGTAVADGRFKTLVAAVQAAKLDGTLSGPGPFTVFAPTDDAFKKLPAGTVETLLKDPEGQLKQILLYHVVPGKVMAADVVKLTSATTVQGQPVTITATTQGVKINNASVVITDIETRNGVIHVIDAVLIPPS
jgi:uncharacterized surface protein with fasciclin (FAS1) repeats